MSSMRRAAAPKAKAFFRQTASGAFDQYLQDIQKLPLISDPAEEKRLARLAQKGDTAAAERLVTANLRFVISDRKSTRLNSSHTVISYAVFCLKKKNRGVELLVDGGHDGL